jgi:hypothetical protein
MRPNRTGAVTRNTPRAAPVAGRRLRLLDLGEDALAALVVLAALVGQRDAAGGAVQQAHVERTLEARQQPHDRGRRHVERVGRGGEAAGLHDPHERLHCAQLVHRGILLRSKH